MAIGTPTATGNAGTVRYDSSVTGARALASATGQAGTILLGSPAGPSFTVRTLAGTPNGRALLVTPNGDTLSSTSYRHGGFGYGPFGYGPFGLGETILSTGGTDAVSDSGLTLVSVAARGRTKVLVG